MSTYLLRGIGILLAGLIFFISPSSRAVDRVRVGDTIKNVSLKGMDGKAHWLLDKKKPVSVFYFFRPDQDHALKGLQSMARCLAEPGSKKVSWVLVVSDAYNKKQVMQVVKQAKIDIPVLIDKGDTLYGKLGFRLHPMVAVVDKSFKLVAVQPYRQVNFANIICAHVHFAMKKISAARRDEILHPKRQKIDESRAKLGRNHKMVQMFIKVKDYPKALKYADKALAKNPDDKEMRVLRSKIVKLCPDCKAKQ